MITDFLNDNYLIIKSLHIIAVIAWMVGLFYLPRLFVYHTKTSYGTEADKLFQTMELKLMKIIMNPSMIATYALGIPLVLIVGIGGQGWLHFKILLVVTLAGFHGFLSKCRKNFAKGENKHSEKFFRIINEVPSIILILVVFLTVLKPF